MKKIFNEKGTVLIISLLALMTLLFLGIYFLSFTAKEFKISKSQILSAQTYYLAEAGVNEAIWKLKNDSVWSANFETDPICETWTATSTRDASSLLANSSYVISINNTACAQADIMSTAIASFSGKSGQRVIKTKVLKALGSLTYDSPIFSGSPSGETNIQSSQLNVYNGNLFCNKNLNIKIGSIVNVYDNASTTGIQEGKAMVVGNVNLTGGSVLNASSTCSKAACMPGCDAYTTTSTACPPDYSPAPAIDFDSSDPSSYRSRAQGAQDAGQCSVLCNGVECSTDCIFSSSDFADLLWGVGQNGVLTLDYKANGSATSTYYVEGGVDVKGERSVIINGVLVVEGNAEMGNSKCWTKGGTKHCGHNQLTINDPGIGVASGLITKGKIYFSSYFSFATSSITGLIYSQNEMFLSSIPNVLNITGGIIARKFSFTSLLSPVNFHLDNVIIREGIWGGSKPTGAVSPPYSPIVTVEHWEETY